MFGIIYRFIAVSSSYVLSVVERLKIRSTRRLQSCTGKIGIESLETFKNTVTALQNTNNLNLSLGKVSKKINGTFHFKGLETSPYRDVKR